MICMGVITGAKGIKGLLKIRSFSDDPTHLVAYGPLTDREAHRHFNIKLVECLSQGAIASCEGVGNRTQAEQLKGTELFVSRKQLPTPDEDEFYHVDLVGMKAVDEHGHIVGNVTAVNNFGAGDFLEISTPHQGVVTLPFSREAVPTLSMEDKCMIVVRDFILDNTLKTQNQEQERAQL